MANQGRGSGAVVPTTSYFTRSNSVYPVGRLNGGAPQVIPANAFTQVVFQQSNVQGGITQTGLTQLNLPSVGGVASGIGWQVHAGVYFAGGGISVTDDVGIRIKYNGVQVAETFISSGAVGHDMALNCSAIVPEGSGAAVLTLEAYCVHSVSIGFSNGTLLHFLSAALVGLRATDA
jgi:hypothetical protein